MQGSAQKSNPLGQNGLLSLKKVGHFRKYGAVVNFPYVTPMVYQHLDKLKRLRNCKTINNVCIQIPCFENFR